MFILVFVIFIFRFTNVQFIILFSWGFSINPLGLCFPWVHNINPLGLLLTWVYNINHGQPWSIVANHGQILHYDKICHNVIGNMTIIVGILHSIAIL